MTFVSTSLERADKWDEICFPVQTRPLETLLPPHYELLATDRQKAIVGEAAPGKFQVFALQGKDYSLIPNQLLREVVDACIPDYRLDIHYTDRGEFSITIILPQQVNVGQEALFKSLIFNNSYSGKSPFTIQGSTLQGQHGTQARVSYYRTVCSNGLMGWADDFSSLTQYQQWLQAGRSPKARKSVAPAAPDLYKRISHKKLDLTIFRDFLQDLIARFMTQESSVTAQVYDWLAQVPAPPQLQDLMAETGLPKQLSRIALERLRKEEKLLRVDSSLWLVYNAINYALLNSRSSLTIRDRYDLDEKALHQLAALAL
ncbi:hypothetical protein SAMN05421823_11441 [Catalinimonas alkaloidigena]|uniref:DUF932 domain-containing protein n=1 Tax=Catalinimonas alkaloidigena TaxID=1075417 RepID=A0A1G9TJP6_9BACT|nr:hypothetical protein [Catalinimonas alkaloidigena]SDM47941.1 hypothetical protein SAMN05421823_11441 [Catalinimonas alkaloidigena]